MKKFRYISIGTLVATALFLLGISPALADTAGYNTIGATNYTLATTSLNNPTGLQITLPVGGTVTKASAAVKAASGTHQFIIKIYNDSAGTRGSLISTSNASATLGTTYSFVDVTFASPPTLSAGTYWLEVIESTGNPGVTTQAGDTGGAANSSYFLNDFAVPVYGTDKYSTTLTYTPNASASAPQGVVLNNTSVQINNGKIIIN